MYILYMCRTTCVIQVYILYMYYMCRTTCVIQVFLLHIYYICITWVEHVYYTCIMFIINGHNIIIWKSVFFPTNNFGNCPMDCPNLSL